MGVGKDFEFLISNFSIYCTTNHCETPFNHNAASHTAVQLGGISFAFPCAGTEGQCAFGAEP